MILFQYSIYLIRYRLTPLIGCLLARYFHGQMGEPGIRCRTMPVLDFRRDVDAVTRLHLDGLFSLFLLVTTSGYTYEDLSAATLCMMDVPIVPAENWTAPPQSLVVTGFNGIHVCVLCKPFVTSSFCQVISLLRPHSKPLLQD